MVTATVEDGVAEYDVDVQKSYWKIWNSRSEYPHERAVRRGERMLQYLQSLGLENPEILDMGCGMGWFANQLANHGRTAGIDLSDEAIEQAKARYPRVDFQAGNVLEMKLPRHRYDVVVSQEVIAHVPDQGEYLRRAADVLKPGGYLILTTPNRFVHDRVHWPDQPPGHIERWLTRRQLIDLMRPQFRLLRWTTVVPLGDRGVLRVVNSARLNRLAQMLVSAGHVQALKEWAGFGWTLVTLAQKREGV